ncbi:hypothetical protein Tco_0261395 [Tanacetum coccineum]
MPLVLLSDEDANHKFLRSLPPAREQSSYRQTKASSSKHKPSHSSGSYSTYTTSSSKATTTATPGLADEVIHSFLATNADDIAMTAIKSSEREQVNRQEASRGQDFKPVRTEKEALLTIDEGQINWVEQTTDEELNHALMAFTVNNELSHFEGGTQELYLTIQSSMMTLIHDHNPYNSIEQGTPVTPPPIPSDNRQNWNQRMERNLGTGYSFVRKPCFVCGSLSHLIKDCDYYENRRGKEAASFKSKRVGSADVRQATPAWTNTNRVNKANQFTPRPVQLSNIKPNLSTASKTIKTGRMRDTELRLDEADTLCFQLGGARRTMTWRQFILALGLHTTNEMTKDGFEAYWDFLRPAPSYTFIRDPVRRLYHRLISYSISGRGQAPEKVTATYLFYLRSIYQGTKNVPYMLA